MIVVQYRATVMCDKCGKTDIQTTSGPPQQTVPADWIQMMPVGIMQMKEFCSQKCANAWKSPIKPWKEDNAATAGES